MDQRKSLLNLLLVSTAALSGYQKGAVNQYNHSQRYRGENSNATTSNTNSNNPAMNTSNTTIPAYNNTNTNPNYTNNTPSANTNYTGNTAYTNNTYNTTTSNPTYNMPPSNQSSNMTNGNTTGYSPNISYYNANNNPNTNYSNNTQPSPNSATALAHSDNTFLPALPAALYAADAASNMTPNATGPFTLPPSEYEYDDLEPCIGEDTLRIHHGTLHQNYVDNLNTALARYPEFYAYNLNELLLFPDRLPSDIQRQILHNAGGHYNHSLVWKTLSGSNYQRPTGDFAAAVNTQFGSFENLKTVLKAAGESVHGTGYAWLAVNPYGRLIVVTTEEQGTPIPLRAVPLLPIDVWEHAYFLDHQEDRGQHIDCLFNLINWELVGNRYVAAMDVFNNANELNS